MISNGLGMHCAKPPPTLGGLEYAAGAAKASATSLSRVRWAFEKPRRAAAEPTGETMHQHDQLGNATVSPFVIHVIWHPECADAPHIAEELWCHFASDRYHQIAGGTGLTVLLHGAGDPEPIALPAMDWAMGEIVAVVALVDEAFATDAQWMTRLNGLTEQAEAAGLANRVFPVALDGSALPNLAVQALRWDRWPGGSGRTGRLIRELTHEFTRMVQHRLASRQGRQDDELRRYREKIQVFLSHSKHDQEGEAVAKAIRGWMNDHSALASFLDVDDMVAGVRFDSAIEDAIRHGVLVAVYTDSYSSREWCRREALLAKRHGVPMLVVDCLRGQDDRAFPYLWNAPVIRMDADQPERVEAVASVLLDEVFRDCLWRQRIEQHRQSATHTVFTARPPELPTAAFAEGIARGEWAIVYPEPPLGEEEKRLFADLLPNVRVSTLNEWLAGA